MPPRALKAAHPHPPNVKNDQPHKNGTFENHRATPVLSERKPQAQHELSTAALRPERERVFKRTIFMRRSLNLPPRRGLKHSPRRGSSHPPKQPHKQEGPSPC
jgi:hypothetical protein